MFQVSLLWLREYIPISVQCTNAISYYICMRFAKSGSIDDRFPIYKALELEEVFNVLLTLRYSFAFRIISICTYRYSLRFNYYFVHSF